MSLVEAPPWIMWLHAPQKQHASGAHRKCYRNQIQDARPREITKQLQAQGGQTQDTEARSRVRESRGCGAQNPRHSVEGELPRSNSTVVPPFPALYRPRVTKHKLRCKLEFQFGRWRCTKSWLTQPRTMGRLLCIVQYTPQPTCAYFPSGWRSDRHARAGRASDRGNQLPTTVSLFAAPSRQGILDRGVHSHAWSCAW